MQITTLLAFLPLLLDHTSSLPLPSATETCAGVESFARRSGDLQDVSQHLLRRCAQRREIHGHLEPLSDLHRRGLSESQHHTLDRRMPPKKVTGGRAKKVTAPPTAGGQSKETVPKALKAAPEPSVDDLASNLKAVKLADDGVDDLTTGLGSVKLADDSSTPPAAGGSKGKEKVEPPIRGNEPDDVPLDPNRKNQLGGTDREKDSERTMYNIVTPNPRKSEGVKDLETGDQYFLRKIGDGDVNAPGRYGTHNPTFGAVQSHGQQPNKKATKNSPGRPRPGMREELATTKHDSKEGFTEWHKITPKTQKQLDEEHALKLQQEKLAAEGKTAPAEGKTAPAPAEDKTTPAPAPAEDKTAPAPAGGKVEGSTPPSPVERPGAPTAWTNEDLRKNLIQQQNNFKNHLAGDKEDTYGLLTQKMLEMCKTEQCRREHAPEVLRRAISEQPHLRKRFENLLKERDELLEMAMR